MNRSGLERPDGPAGRGPPGTGSTWYRCSVATIANADQAGARVQQLVEHVANRPIGGCQSLRGRVRAPVLVSALAVAAASCAPAGRPQFPARPPSCALETIKSLPQRPYIELETFFLHSPESMRDVLDAVQERACQDGADAIYAPKAGRAYAYAIALKWKDAPPAPPAP